MTAGNVALALSGGGSRAIAFHLGCLRALHKNGILQNVAAISSVSGGSVLAALYCHHPGDFDSFEAKVRKILAHGFLRPAWRIAFTTREGVAAIACFFPLVLERLAACLIRSIMRPIAPRLVDNISWLKEPLFNRSASRTTILRRVFSELFNGDTLPQLRADRPKLIILACELQHQSAFYFASDGVGSWRLGEADPQDIEIAQAVAASAAYPGLLPALDERMTFRRHGTVETKRVVLTDGGVYDNLGLAPLWPDRDPRISLHVENYERIIACRAGYGLKQGPPAIFWPSRMIAVLNCALSRAENVSINRLFDLQKSGKLKGVLLPYLGQADNNLAFPPDDLVTASEVAAYPTDFSPMPHNWITLLSQRGEQLVHSLLREHWSDLLDPDSDC